MFRPVALKTNLKIAISCISNTALKELLKNSVHEMIFGENFLCINYNYHSFREISHDLYIFKSLDM